MGFNRKPSLTRRIGALVWLLLICPSRAQLPVERVEKEMEAARPPQVAGGFLFDDVDAN